MTTSKRCEARRELRSATTDPNANIVEAVALARRLLSEHASQDPDPDSRDAVAKVANAERLAELVLAPHE